MSNETLPLKEWLVPVMVAEEVIKRVVDSRSVDVPGLGICYVYIWHEPAGWYGQAEWRRRGQWREGVMRGRYESATEAELAVRMDLEEERQKHGQ